jgi:hypothetical protein
MMEIHPPHAIHSAKDFLLQLLTITIGILIALALEGAELAEEVAGMPSIANAEGLRVLAQNKRVLLERAKKIVLDFPHLVPR